MRPAGEIRQAVLKAAADLIEEIRLASKADDAPKRKGPTLAEIAARAAVAKKDARICISNCTRAKVPALEIVGQRRVPNRNRPAAEYAPGAHADLFNQAQPSGVSVLGSTLQAWAR